MAVNGSVRRGNKNGAEEPAEDDVDDDVDDAPAVVKVVHRQTPSGAQSPSISRRLLPFVLAALSVIVVVLVILVVLAPAKSKGRTSAPTTLAPLPPTGSKTFVDKQAGFQVSYPASWKLQTSTDPTVVLQLDFNNDVYDTLLVRVQPIQALVNTSNLNDIQAFTDGIISGTNVKVLQRQSFSKSGLLGYNYFYTFASPPVVAGDATSTIPLVHSHFFVFPPHEMVELVFQTRAADFNALAKSFDQVWGSFQPAT